MLDVRSRWGPTIGDMLAERQGQVPGFNAMRFVAASAVLVSHSFGAAENRQSQEPLRQLTSVLELGTLSVFIFFFISGFVITQSCTRSASSRSYLLKRIARIMPGLILVTLVCALLLGPAMTSYSLTEYFTDQKFYQFYLNCSFILKGQLPGVFENNPSGDHVNVSLWTLRHEVFCYILILLVVATGRLSWLLVSVLALALPLVAYPPIVAAVARYLEHVRSAMSLSVNIPYLFRESMHIIPFFFVGSLFFYIRDYIVMNRVCLVISLIVMFAVVLLGGIFPIFPFVLGYVILYAGFSDNRFFALFKRNDYSYGIYIFAFPVQQTLVALSPNGMTWWENTLLAYPIVLCLAALSWHFVERPSLQFAKSLDKKAVQRPRPRVSTSKSST